MIQPHRIACPALALMLLLLCSRFAAAQSATAVSSLDPDRFAGSWNEIARYPVRREKQCASDEIVLYAVGDKKNSLEVVTSCQIKIDQAYSWNDKGKFDSHGTGALKLSRFFILHSRYWVLAVDPGYAWALVGNPNHKSLWILSKTPTLPPDVLAGIESKAAAQGFNTANLVQIPPHSDTKSAE